LPEQRAQSRIYVGQYHKKRSKAASRC
jgi:hypothetical protein